MTIQISLTQFLTFKAFVSTNAKYNYILKQKNNDGYHPSHDYWKNFREAIHRLPYNNGDLTVLYDAVDMVKPEKKANYTKSVNTFINFVSDNDVTFFEVGKAKWNFENELVINASPDIGMIIDGKKYFVKVFPNVQQKKSRLDSRSVKSILTLLQETNANFNTSSGTFAVLRVNSPRFFKAEAIKERDSKLLKIDAANFVNCWEAV